MGKLRVAFTHVYFRPDGGSAYAGYNISPLQTHRGIEITVLPPSSVIEAKELADVDVLVMSTGETKIRRSSLQGNGRLALITRGGAGYDDVDISACTADHVAVQIATDVVRRPTAVASLTLLLAITTRLLQKHAITLKGPREWARLPDFYSVDLRGKTLGLVGFGSIGSEFARLAAPLQMRIIAHDPQIKAETAAASNVCPVSLETLLQESDVVSLHVPLTDSTRHLMNADRLRLMKPSAFLINASRGGVVDQRALTECLQRHGIAGAALDVLEKEPPEADDPILGLDNVLFSGHALAWTENLNALLAENHIKAIFDIAQGRPPTGIVNAGVLKSPEWRQKVSRLSDRWAIN